MWTIQKTNNLVIDLVTEIFCAQFWYLLPIFGTVLKYKTYSLLLYNRILRKV